MAVGTLEDDLLTIDKHTILFVAVIAVPVFYRTETKLLSLYMDGFTLRILEGEDSCIEVGLFSIPQFGILDAEVNLGLIAGSGKGRTGSGLLSIGVDDVDVYRTARKGPIQEYIRHEVTVSLGIDGYTLYISGWLTDDEDRTPDTTEVPIVGTPLSKVDLRIGAFFQDLHFQMVLFLTKEHTIRHIYRMPRKASLIGADTCLTTINLYTDFSESSFEY